MISPASVIPVSMMPKEESMIGIRAKAEDHEIYCTWNVDLWLYSVIVMKITLYISSQKRENRVEKMKEIIGEV